MKYLRRDVPDRTLALGRIILIRTGRLGELVRTRVLLLEASEDIGKAPVTRPPKETIAASIIRNSV